MKKSIYPASWSKNGRLPLTNTPPIPLPWALTQWPSHCNRFTNNGVKGFVCFVTDDAWSSEQTNDGFLHLSDLISLLFQPSHEWAWLIKHRFALHTGSATLQFIQMRLSATVCNFNATLGLSYFVASYLLETRLVVLAKRSHVSLPMSPN